MAISGSYPNNILMKKYLGIIGLLTALTPTLSYSDWSGPEDDSGYWGPPFCDTQPDDFEGICTATPERFSFTLSQFRLRKMEDKSFVNLASAPQEFDFASASAGSQLGNFASGANVPAGVYDAFSFVGLENITMRGEATLNGGSGPRCRTTTSGVATDGSPAQNYVVSSNETPLFDAIGEGSDEVEGQAEGPNIEINYLNSSNQFVFIGDSILGTTFPLTINDGQSLTFDFSMRPVKGIVFEWDGAGNCTAAYSGDMQIRISATVE